MLFKDKGISRAVDLQTIAYSTSYVFREEVMRMAENDYIFDVILFILILILLRIIRKLILKSQKK